MTTLIKKYLPVIILAMTGMLGQNLKAQDFNISQDAVSCNVGQGRIILNVTAGTGPFDYYLYDHDPFLPGGPLQSVENSPFDTVVFIDVPLSGPTYYIRFRATEGTLIRTTTVTIAQTQQLTANIFVAQALSCPSSTDAVLSTTVTGGNPPYTYLWGPGGQDTPSITVGQGVYSVSVNDSYNCQNSQSEPTYFFLEGDDSIPTALEPGSVASSHTICINTSPSGFTNVVFADGGWGHTYQWQDSISGGSWQNIPGATSDTYDDPNNLIQTRYYRRAAISTSGCGTVYSNILTVTVVAAPVAEAGGNITICSGTSAIAMTGASGTGSFSAATWSGGAGMGTWSQNANPALATFTPSVASGTFTATLTLTGSYGCSNSTDTRTITWGTPPVAEAGNAIASCTGMAAITMTGATATGTFSAATWSGGAGLGTWTQNGNPALAVFTPSVTSGSFTATLTLTGSNGCGDVTDTRTISWGTAPVAEAGSNISSCTGMSAILMTGATATGTYSAVTWSGGAGSGTWTQNADPALATFTPTVASGTFTATLTLTGSNGCGNATDTRTISWGTAPTADADGDITSCTGMGALTMTGATATGTFSAVTWSGGAGLGNWTQNGNPALAVFTPTVASGSFTATLTLTGSNGCGNSTDTRIITWGTAPIAEAGSNIASCTGMAAIQMTGATASGTYSAVTWSGGLALGTWTQNGNPALATFTPTAASGSFTATLTLTGSNGCGNSTDTRTISWGTAPTAEAGSDITSCTGTALITMTGATASGTYTVVTWSGGAGLGTWVQNTDPALATFTPSVASGSFTATLTLTGTNGCSNATDTRTITWGTAPTAEAGNDITSCTGMAALAMTGATANGTYSATTWSGGAGSGTWTQNANPALATFTPTVASGSFTATLTLTGSNGCGNASDTRLITWGTAPTAEAGANISTCTGLAAILMTGATSNGTFSAVTWTGGAGLGTWTQNANPALATFTPTLASGSFTATLTLTGSNGCGNATDTRTISWGTAPTAEAGSDITTCTGTSAIGMTGASGTGTFSAATWSGGAGLGTWTQNVDPALATFTPTVASGSFTATLTLTGANGCSNSADTRLLTWGTAPVAEAGTDITSCTGMAAITMTGATATGTFSAITWSGGGGLGSWTQNPNPALATFTPSIASGSFTATLTLTGSNGCGNATDTRTITWGTAPTAEAGSNIITCTGTAAIAMTGATANGTFSAVTWSGGAALGTWIQNVNPALATFTPTAASGSFTATLTLTGSNGCGNATDTRTITWGTAPTVEAGSDITTCTGLSSISMTGSTASGTYSAVTWSGGAALGTWTQNANPALATFTPTVASGSFTATLTLTGSNGCGNVTDTRLITWGTAPVADAGNNIASCTGLSAIAMSGATATGTFSASTWTGGAGLGTWTQNANPALATFTPTVASGSFTATLTLTGSNGCSDATDTRTIAWGTAPIAEAGTDITSCTGTAAITMSGATATGTFSAATWTGGAGLGTWAQNVDPALATFTPTTASGTFTATLTLTGTNGCSNSTDTRIISWGTAPTAEAGSDITSCTGTLPIAMTGATANGTYSAATWTGGAGLGTWTQNANPALATFTPTVTSGSFTATLTLTGSNGCGNAIDTRIITWGTAPAAEAGTDIASCTGMAAILMSGATATGTYSAVNWSGGAGLGTWTQNIDPALAVFTPTTISGSFTATLTLTGTNGCSNATDTRIISWGTAPIAEAGSDIASCTGLTAISMTGATAGGTYTAVTWSGGSGLGVWVQNTDPALATFTPSVASGSFTATLTLTGSNGCGNATDTRTISWGTAPTTDAGNDITSCTGMTPIAMTGATTAGTFSAATWTGGAGLGTWTQNANPSLASFTPSVASGSFTATLTLTGSNGCGNATDTRLISWGTAPAANAGTDISSCSGMAAILMTGATATGTFSSATWTGGAGLGAWTQNANPALASFTPTQASGSFTATLTLTGSNGCSNAIATRVISWGTAPTVDAGLNISSCTGLAAISMTGATATGTYSAATWSGGEASGTWTQNVNPALAIFTPTTPSGSFVATLTLTGSNGCGNVSDTRTISWNTTPTVSAGMNDSVCFSSTNYLLEGNAANYNTVQWSIVSGFGTFQGGINNVLNPTYQFGVLDYGSGNGSVVILQLQANGLGACASTIVRDTVEIRIAPEVRVSIGSPAPFYINPNTEIEVCLSTSGHQRNLDMGYYLMAPDGETMLPLKKGPQEFNFFTPCTPVSGGIPGDVVDLCFTTELDLEDTLNICTHSRPISGTFAATGDWSIWEGIVSGKVLFGGADYQNLSSGPTIDARYLWQTTTGEIIIVRNVGPGNGLIPIFETSVDGKFNWLNSGKYASSPPGGGKCSMPGLCIAMYKIN